MGVKDSPSDSCDGGIGVCLGTEKILLSNFDNLSWANAADVNVTGSPEYSLEAMICFKQEYKLRPN